MDPATITLLASLGVKGLSALFGNRAKGKQEAENRRAATSGLNIGQKQREDARRARLALANGLLGGVPGTTAGGGVNTNVGLDPALFERLNQERTYDFGSTMPQSKGGIDAFLSGLFGGAADVIPRIDGGATSHSGNGMPTPSQPMPQQGVPAIDLDELRALGKTTGSYA